MPKSPRKRKDCAPGKVRNEKTGRCIKDIKDIKKKECPPGKIRNEKTGRCIKDKDIKKKECPPGKIRNEKTGRCINDPVKKKKSPKKPGKTSLENLENLENVKPVVHVNVKPGPFDAALRCQSGDKRCSLVDIVNDENIAKYIFYNNEKQCAYYKKGDQMGQPSLFGSIYYTCCDEEDKPPKKCNHITKIVKFNNRQDYLNFYSEISAHQIAAKAGLAPAIVKVYLTEKQGIIIMQKMKETLWELMSRNMGLFITLKIPEERVREIARGWATEVGKLLVEFHHLGMLHNDTHSNNFMLDDKGKLYMIDFGRTNTRHYKEVIKRGEKFVALCDVYHDKTNYSAEKCTGLLEYEYRQIEWAQESRDKYPPTDPYYWAFDAYAKRLIEIKNIEIGWFRDGKLVL
jgi:tRNA A-37 threonylcarbamoyl transferase component Bud32